MVDPRSRRNFLVSTSHAIAGLALAPLVGCNKPANDNNTTKAASPAKTASGGEPAKRPVAPPSSQPTTPVRGSLSPAVRGSLLGPGRHDDPAGGPRQHYLSVLDLDSASEGERLIQRIPMTFFGHGVTPRPDRPWLAVVFEKKGPGCCELDLRAGRITRRITTKKERQFYGHGVFSKDGKRLFCTEAVVDDASYKGVIAVRDGGTYALLGTLDSHGHAPHDLHMVDDGRTLVVTNGGGTFASGQAPSVVWLDWQADKLVRRRELNSPKVNAGHLAVGEGNALTVVSAPRTGMDKTAPTFVGGVSFLTNDKLHTSSHQVAKELRGEVLSVAIDPATGIAATTCPDGGKLLFWDAATGGLLASRDLAHARGVALTLDGQWFAVTHGKDALVTMFGTRSLKPATKAMQSWMTGSHVITHKLRGV